ncbi:hypothetical protein [Methylocystis echinoides]|uniref:Uncharacterized protein n=1 Tax=Methylocystis echinoides TaxID=29468 RepID=A0A9W6LUH7_9HYPH|nr:hypothetical protein [Methylocystis echinoides]GLI95484.1 hypothetical protein LMG27198_44760 [Methylocystis echinoides]
MVVERSLGWDPSKALIAKTEVVVTNTRDDNLIKIAHSGCRAIVADAAKFLHRLSILADTSFSECHSEENVLK